jgi:hypothetical protein
MKKIILLIIPILSLCGCENQYSIYVNSQTCEEYFINEEEKIIIPQYDNEGMIQKNKDCLDKKNLETKNEED